MRARTIQQGVVQLGQIVCVVPIEQQRSCHGKNHGKQQQIATPEQLFLHCTPSGNLYILCGPAESMPNHEDTHGKIGYIGR